MKRLLYSALPLLVFAAMACTSGTKQMESENSESAITEEEASFIGDFVTEGYFDREKGFDWTVVRIFMDNQGSIKSEISSRSDLKRPSCTWKTDLEIKNPSTLEAQWMDDSFLFEVIGDSLFIKGSDEKSDESLYFFCNGGASLKNSYVRLEESFDSTQISGYTFEQELELQGISFEVHATEQNPYTTILIETEGLEIDSTPVTHQVDGGYIKSEIEDLNSDGWPELLVYFNSYGMEMKSFLIGYSVNNGKSMSRISMPELSEEAAAGFQGQDEFAIVETSLVRRFPVYKLEDGKWIPSGKTRQIQYKLRDGEAAREFYEVSIMEF